MTTASATLSLNPEARRKLAQAYRYLLSLSGRKQQKAASRETVDGQTRPAASVEAASQQQDHPGGK